MEHSALPLFLSLIRSSLWGTKIDLQGQERSHYQFINLMKLAQEQAVVGLMSQGLIDSGVKLVSEDALNLFALQQCIRRQNSMMDKAVVELCQLMADNGIPIFVFKGQTIARSYSDVGIRQSGDIDFYCYPEYWNRALHLFKDKYKVSLNDLYTEKDVEFTVNGIAYEMHNRLTLFANPCHSRYWEDVVMPEIIANPYFVTINGYDVPTLAPTYNVLYVFVHIFQHLISEGIGLRQFCDWARLLGVLHDEIDVDIIDRHLKGIGLRKAYNGLGAILTDYLGLPEESFPFTITEDDRRRAKELMDDIMEKGNFGHNHPCHNKPGIKHGIGHLQTIFRQSLKFGHYAPNEVWWKIPYMFKWWSVKIKRMLLK